MNIDKLIDLKQSILNEYENSLLDKTIELKDLPPLVSLLSKGKKTSQVNRIENLIVKRYLEDIEAGNVCAKDLGSAVSLINRYSSQLEPREETESELIDSLVRS